MIEVKHQYSLKDHNTFGISATAETYCRITTIQQLQEALSYFKNEAVFLLGGGSNMLLINNVERPVIHLDLKGKEIIPHNNDEVLLKVAAGENWHELVMFCVKNNLAGIENLAFIPGNTGTAPIQNIGAYGVELKDSFYSCEVVELATGNSYTFNLAQCKFGYRDSIFKNEALGKYAITAVTLKLKDLKANSSYVYKTDYGAIQSELEQLPGELSLNKVAQAVINIRTNKLPDPKIIGNSGSFFKNPIVSRTTYNKLKLEHPAMPHYDVDDQNVKIPAGWLIENSGFKGKRYGDAGVHDKQALVLVNHGTATGKEILAVAQIIQKEIKKRYNVTIETEVNLIEN